MEVLIIQEIQQAIDEQKREEETAAKTIDTVEYWRMFYHCHRRLEKLMHDIISLSKTTIQ